VGNDAFVPARQVAEQPPRALGVTARTSPAHRAAHSGAQPLGQRIGDIALLVRAAALNQRAAPLSVKEQRIRFFIV
jgi:hypothetical protein